MKRIVRVIDKALGPSGFDAPGLGVEGDDDRLEVRPEVLHRRERAVFVGPSQDEKPLDRLKLGAAP